MKINERKTVIAHLHNAKHVRPEQSMNYVLCLLPNDNKECTYQWAILAYSKKHDAFNAHDICDDAHSAIEVSFWAELPEFEQ